MHNRFWFAHFRAWKMSLLKLLQWHTPTRCISGSTSYTYVLEHALHNKERNVFYLFDSNVYMCIHYDVGNGLFAAHSLYSPIFITFNIRHWKCYNYFLRYLIQRTDEQTIMCFVTCWYCNLISAGWKEGEKTSWAFRALGRDNVKLLQESASLWQKT